MGRVQLLEYDSLGIEDMTWQIRTTTTTNNTTHSVALVATGSSVSNLAIQSLFMTAIPASGSVSGEGSTSTSSYKPCSQIYQCLEVAQHFSYDKTLSLIL